MDGKIIKRPLFNAKRLPAIFIMYSPWRPEELSFITEQETILSISPHFTMDQIELISGKYGPFSAGIPTQVPMWFAFFLSSSESCTLIPPKWLSQKYLRQFINAEKADKAPLQKPPCSHYMEIAFAFIIQAPKVVPELDKVRMLIEDLWAKRVEKIRKFYINEIDGNKDDSFLIPNITQMELHMYRMPFIQIEELFMNISNKAKGIETEEEDLNDI